MKKSKVSLVTLCALFIVFGMVYSASAGLVYSGAYADMYLKVFPSGLTEEMVYLDGVKQSAPVDMVTGHVGSQTDTRLVTFASTTDKLYAGSGFATIQASDNFINNLTITAPGAFFKDLIFSVQTKPAGTTNLTIIATDKSGGSDSFSGMGVEAAWVTGLNDILVLSTDSNLMRSVTITSGDGFSVFGVDQVKHTQISGYTAVPVPPSVWLLGSGLVGLVGLRRRFFRK